ncbi:MAG: response regulator transcription factor [Firmicutes bacterium]|nr:response regulator transcription factor [Bacillota bacterium]
MRKILVADDEKSITDIIAYNLSKENYKAICAYNGEEAWELFKTYTFDIDLVILDVMMSGLNGFEVCKKIRTISKVPVIFLTARAEEEDKVNGLEIGGDDYVTKPFGIRELMARIRLRLKEAKRRKPYQQNVAVCGRVKINFTRYEIFIDNEPVHLTPKEFDLIKFLIINRGKVFSRDDLLKTVWEYEYSGDARTVDVTVRRLRAKIEKNPEEPEIVLTKRGIGYYVEDAQQKRRRTRVEKNISSGKKEHQNANNDLSNEKKEGVND